MPIYEYETPTGEVIEQLRPVTNPDIPGLRRIIPSRLNVMTAHAPSPIDQTAQVQRGLRRLEERGELKGLEFSRKQVRQAWAT